MKLFLAILTQHFLRSNAFRNKLFRTIIFDFKVNEVKYEVVLIYPKYFDIAAESFMLEISLISAFVILIYNLNNNFKLLLFNNKIFFAQLSSAHKYRHQFHNY